MRAVLISSTIARTGTVIATLSDASSIGILVQRITRVTKLRGEKTYELETSGACRSARSARATCSRTGTSK